MVLIILYAIFVFLIVGWLFQRAFRFPAGQRVGENERATRRGLAMLFALPPPHNTHPPYRQTGRSGLPHIQTGNSGNASVLPGGGKKLPSAKSRIFTDIYSFPNCPVCWSSNQKGEPQYITYDSRNDCFCCYRNHRYRKNGVVIP